MAQVVELVFSQNSSSRVFFCFAYLDQPFMMTKHVIFFNSFFHRNFFFVGHLQPHDRKYAKTNVDSITFRLR